MSTRAIEEAASIVELTVDECMQLLASLEIGRVAVAFPGGAPIVVPVNYVVDGGVVVFRTDPGSKLSALREHPLSFQVDVIDPIHRTGWSVLVQGVAEEATPALVDHLALTPWAGGVKAHWIRVLPSAIAGRRVCLVVDQLEPSGYL